MPSKRIPKKKLACATKETKEGKQYTTCYEKKVTPARTFRVKKKVPVPEKKTSAKKPAAKKKTIKQVRQEEYEKHIEESQKQIRKNQLEDRAKAEAKKAADPYNKTFKRASMSTISARGKFGMYSKGGGRAGAGAQHYEARGDDEVARGDAGLSIFDKFPAAFKDRLLRNPGEYQTINGKQFKYNAAILPSARKEILNRILDENLAAAPPAAKKDPNALRYDKYLPPGLWKNLGEHAHYGKDDTRLQDYAKSFNQGKFSWIPDKTPHPFAGEIRPKDHFDEFADISYAKYSSRKEYIEGERKRIDKIKNPEHDPFASQDSDYWKYVT